MKILVTGAGGKTGRAIIRQLDRAGIEVVAFVRKKRPFPSHISQVLGDLESEADLKKAVDGVDKIYLICPNMHPREFEIGKLVVKVAKETAVSHIVYHSVLHPQVEAMPHHWHKMRFEEHLFESNIPFTILQPTAYMQNIQLDRVKETAVYQTPYPVTAQISLVHLDDVAEIAAKVLTESGHLGAIYELVGTMPLTQTAVAEAISEALKIPVEAKEQSLSEWQNQAQAAQLPKHTIQTLKKMFQYYAKFGLIGNPMVLKMLLGREPRGLGDWMIGY
ncbi:MAG: NmrA family NAD(P)-binding protein [Chloroflexota bacterium]